MQAGASERVEEEERGGRRRRKRRRKRALRGRKRESGKLKKNRR